jgi:hypothetical protein
MEINNLGREERHTMWLLEEEESRNWSENGREILLL